MVFVHQQKKIKKSKKSKARLLPTSKLILKEKEKRKKRHVYL